MVLDITLHNLHWLVRWKQINWIELNWISQNADDQFLLCLHLCCWHLPIFLFVSWILTLASLAFWWPAIVSSTICFKTCSSSRRLATNSRIIASAWWQNREKSRHKQILFNQFFKVSIILQINLLIMFIWAFYIFWTAVFAQKFAIIISPDLYFIVTRPCSPFFIKLRKHMFQGCCK